MAGAPPRFDGRFLSDTAWNYAAFAVMAVTGVVLNVFIAAAFGIETLGVFNQIYALYVVMAQLAVMGIHDSAQKHNAEFQGEPERQDRVAESAFWLAAVIGAGVAALVYLGSGAIGRLADSPAVGRGVALVAPGLLFFAVNKVLMGVLNGRRRMKAFAAAQAFRAGVILLACVGVWAMGLPGYALGASFTIAEAALLPGLVRAVGVRLRPAWGEAAFRSWTATHLRFGAKACVNGFLAESYVRVDIIMLGIFVGDFEVGLYSFAALFVEGLYQIPVVVRTIANPVLVRLLAAGDTAEIRRLARRAGALSVAAFAAAGAAVVVLYPALAPYFPPGLIDGSTRVLTILVLGLAVYAVFIPVDHIVMQAGMPGRQSVLMAANVVTNAGLNLALIPLFGITGAAAATALAFAVSSVNVNWAAWRWLGLRGGPLVAGG